MSLKAMNYAWDHSQAKGNALLVLLCLADHADFQGNCFPSVPYIAHRCKISERSVQDHLATLVKLGEVTRSERPGRSTVYHVVTPADSAPPQILRPADSRVEPPQNLRPTPATFDGTPAESAPITVRTTKEPSTEPTTGDPLLVDGVVEPPAKPSPSELLDAEFEIWYAAYPKHVAVGDALRAYRTARKIASAEVLLAGAQRLAQFWPKGVDKTYLKGPAPWLNQRCWLDEEVHRPHADGNGSGNGYHEPPVPAYQSPPTTPAAELPW